MSVEQGFWGRRRARVAAEEQAEQAAQAQLEAERIEAEMAELSDAELLAAFDLPDPDSMKLGDDFTAFMAKAIPEHLRRRALRSLWRSNPVLANVDMLVDYGEDFTDSAMAVENIQTAYQVGKGMLKHVQEMARQAALQDDPAEEEPALEDIIEDEPEVPMALTDEDPTEGADTDVAEVTETAEDWPAEEAITPRRMKFRLVAS